MTNNDEYLEIAELINNVFLSKPKLTDNIILKISPNAVYSIPVDLAIMAQDVNRVFGPTPPIDLNPHKNIKEEVRQLIEDIEFHFEPNKQGDTLVTKNNLCAARYMLEAVIYNVDQEPITREDVVRYVLESCFIKIIELGISSVAMNPLGTEYGVIPANKFIQMLEQTYEKYKYDLSGLKTIILAPRKTDQCQALHQAIQQELGVTVEIVGQ